MAGRFDTATIKEQVYQILRLGKSKPKKACTLC